jgi:hypothetical protein
MLAASSSHAATPIEVIKVQPHKVHPYLLGKWCSDDGEHYMGDDQCNNDSVIDIKADRYIGWEHGCRYTSVNSWVSPVAMATKTQGSPALHVIANCEGEGCRWREELTLEYYAKASVTIRRRQLGKESCSG